MENEGSHYSEYFNPKNGRRLEPVSKTNNFDYGVLDFAIQLLLIDSRPQPYPEDLNNYETLTLEYSQC
jgi:hypothetical protein